MGETNVLLLFISMLLLLGFSGFFSGSETALMAISKLRLAHIAETKPKRASIVQNILKQPERLIGTILLGNNLVNVAMSAIATAFAISLWGQRGIIYVTGILTVVILIFAEITPKVYAKYFNERVSLKTAPVMKVLMIVLSPVVNAVTYVSGKILYLIGIDVTRIEKPLMTEAEIRTCIKMGWDEGAITADERQLLARVFTLNDKAVGEIMIPKSQMTTLQIDTPVEEAMKIVVKTGHSRFPVFEGNDSEIVGFVHVKDFFEILLRKQPDSLKKILRPPSFAAADKKIGFQLRNFQSNKLHQAVVLDQNGKVAGLVTLEDIIEELVGSIRDEHDA